MPFFKDLKYSEEIHVYTWSLNEALGDLKLLCTRRGIGINSIKNIQANNRASEILVEKLLVKIVFGDNASLDHHPNGAPFITESDVNISITHTPGFVCLATNAHGPIGIDIERKGTRVIKVRDHFLNIAEKEFISPDDSDHNLIAWTAKEAIYKIISSSVPDYKEMLYLTPFESLDTGNLHLTGYFDDGNSRKRQFDIITHSDIDYIFTLAVEHGTLLDAPDKDIYTFI